jgi:hypothetical protein
MCPGFSRSATRAALATWVVAATCRRRVSPSSGEARTDGLVMSALRSLSVFCASSVQRKELDFFSILYRGAHVPQPGHEAAEGCEAPQESLNVLNVPDLTHFGNGQNLVRVYFDAVLGDDVPHELAPGDSDGAFSGFNLMLNHRRLLKVSSRSEMRLSLCRDFVTMTLRLRPICSLKQNCIRH